MQDVFVQGVVYAAAQVSRFGEASIAKDLLIEAGLSHLDTVRFSGADKFDVAELESRVFEDKIQLLSVGQLKAKLRVTGKIDS